MLLDSRGVRGVVDSSSFIRRDLRVLSTRGCAGEAASLLDTRDRPCTFSVLAGAPLGPSRDSAGGGEEGRADGPS